MSIEDLNKKLDLILESLARLENRQLIYPQIDNFDDRQQSMKGILDELQKASRTEEAARVEIMQRLKTIPTTNQ